MDTKCTSKTSHCNKKKKHPQKQKQLSKKAFEKVLEEVKHQDSKLKEVNMTIALTVKILEEQLTKGIKITKLQRELHEIIRNFEMCHLKTVIPLHTMDFEQDFKVISKNIDEIGKLYEQLDQKCDDWKQNFKKHNLDHYTFGPNDDTPSKPFYVDPFRYANVIPPDNSNDYYEPCPVCVRQPSSHHQCQFVGHHRRCPSPKKRISRQNASYVFIEPSENTANQAWTNQFEKELQEITYLDTFNSEECLNPIIRNFEMNAKDNKVNKREKAKLVSYGNQQDSDNEDYHQAARRCSEEIFHTTWQDKKRIRTQNQCDNAPFTQIERAFVASAISTTTEGEIEQDKEKEKVAALELKSEMINLDMDERMKAQQLQIDTLTRELEELRKERQFCIPSVASHHSDPVIEHPKVIRTSNVIQDITTAAPVHGEISYTMNAMLEKYETLDEDSKNELLKYAISTGKEHLQSRLLMLRQGKSGTSLAKLTKELIKLAESYNVPELKFDEQASKRRLNYQAWLMKVQPILAMFSQTASVLPRDKVVPFSDPNTIGNCALYVLISSRTDSYFQRAIKQFKPFGDEALELLQEHCAHIS
jgi:hypothetical protein